LQVVHLTLPSFPAAINSLQQSRAWPPTNFILSYNLEITKMNYLLQLLKKKTFYTKKMPPMLARVITSFASSIKNRIHHVPHQLSV
jgi:hypothetical protein